MKKFITKRYALVNPTTGTFETDYNGLPFTFETRAIAREEKRLIKQFDGLDFKIAKVKATYNVEQFVR